MTAQTPLEEQKVIGDLIVRELDTPYSREQATFKNNTGGTLSFGIGTTLLTSTTFRVPAPAGDADAVLLNNITDLANNGTVEVAILVRGPVVIDVDQLEFISSVDSSEQATQIADLLALGIVGKSEPETVEDAGE